MNKVINKLLAVLLIPSLLLGCVKETEQQQPQEGLHEVVFHAGWAPETKTVLQEDGSVWWSPGDEISLFVGNTNANYHLTSTNDVASAATDFVGDISEKPAGSHFVAVFPYNGGNGINDNIIHSEVPGHQKATPGTFDTEAFLSVARSDNETLYFRNVCSGIKFSVLNDGIKKVEFKPYYVGSEESLAGYCEISFDENEMPYISSFISIERSVALEAPSGEYFIPGQNYYVSIIPGTYSKGLIVTYYKDNEKAKYHIDKEIIAKKSVIGKIGQLDGDLVFSPYYNSVSVLPSGGLWRYLNGNTVKKICFVSNSDKVTSMQLADDIYYDYVNGTVSFYTSADAFKAQSAGSDLSWDLWGNMPDDIRKGVEDIDFGVFEIPTFDGNPYAYNRYNGESTFGVNKKAPKDQQAVAQDFVKFFLCDDESQVDFNLAMSTFPAKKSLADNEEILKNPSLKVLAEHIDHYIWPGPMPSCVEEDMKKAGEDIFYNGVDIDTALDKAQADIIKDMKSSSFQSVENLYEFAK